MKGKLGLAGLIIFVAAVSFVLCSAWDWRSLVVTQPKPGKNFGAKLIPHTLTGIANCMECHQSGLGGRAPQVTHKLWSQDCLACHSTAAMLAGTPAPPAADRKQWAKNLQPPARQKGEYVILSWNDVGMKCVSDNDKHFGLHYPSQVLWAQVFRRGDPPTLVTSGVELRYAAPEGRRNPAATLDFWNYVKVMHKKDIPVNVGMAGLSADQGKFTFNPEYNAYIARGIPVSPYDDSGKPDPYPLFSLQLTDLATGAVLAETKVNTPVSAENGCYRCHGGTPNRGTGFGDETSKNFLAVHDKKNNTTLLADAEAGKPAFCQSCHAAANIGAKGNPERLTLSAAMHGWHAQYLKGGTVDTCGVCHPSSSSGTTVCLRDVHAGNDVSCGQCHGEMRMHAGAVLMFQSELPAARRSMDRLRGGESWGPVTPQSRQPWAQEPDCLSCHVNHTKAPKGASSYNHWVAGMGSLFRNDTANFGIMCAACHGSPHLVYPNSTYGDRKVNYQPEAYQGIAAPIAVNNRCSVCHISPITGDAVHSNMSQPFVMPMKSRP